MEWQLIWIPYFNLALMNVTLRASVLCVQVKLNL